MSQFLAASPPKGDGYAEERDRWKDREGAARKISLRDREVTKHGNAANRPFQCSFRLKTAPDCSRCHDIVAWENLLCNVVHRGAGVAVLLVNKRSVPCSAGHCDCEDKAGQVHAQLALVLISLDSVNSDYSVVPGTHAQKLPGGLKK